MDLKKFYFVNILFYFLFIALLITSCGSYQYSGYINDGIYQNNEVSENYAVTENKEINNKENNKAAFAALLFITFDISNIFFSAI